jgi:hypothetical protein
MGKFDNYCNDCGRLISDEYLYCYDCSFDTCKCGNSKKREFEHCKECNQMIIDAENKLKYGFGVCPFCGHEFIFSEFLNSVIVDEKVRLIANLITHYRHNHQLSWNKSCHYISSKWGNDAYEKAKIEHNNRAKRQIIWKCKDWIIENNLSSEHFMTLSNNDDKTVELVLKSFN